MGIPEKAVQHSLLLSDIYTKQGSSDMADSELQSALEIDPENPIVLAKLGMAPVAPAPVAAPPPEIMQDHLDIATTMPQIPSSAFEETPPILEPVSTGDSNIAFEGLDTQLPPANEVLPPAETLDTQLSRLG